MVLFSLILPDEDLLKISILISVAGLRIVDSILPVGRGQRQLILGDRYTGKTSIYLSLLLLQCLWWFIIYF